jgi:hypothetical protein
VLLFQLARRLDPVQPGHGNIEEYKVRLQAFRGLDNGTAVFGSSDKLAVSFQQFLESLEDQRMIVSQ